MSAHIVRRVLALAGAGALAITGVVGIAGPASAKDAYTAGSTITSLPARAHLAGGETVTVSLATPAGLVCSTAWTTRVVGQRLGATVPAAPPTCSVPDATGVVTASWVVTAAAGTNKRTAVVKFIATNPADGSRMVSSLVVKVNRTVGHGKPTS